MVFIMVTCGRLLALGLFFTSLFNQLCAQGFQPSRQSIMFHEIIKQFEQEMQNAFGLASAGAGGRVHDKIEEFQFFFSTDKDFSIKDARILEVQVCEHLLDIINNNCSAELLDHKPFTSKDIIVHIRLNDTSDKPHNYQTLGDKLAAVSVNSGNLYFDKLNPKKSNYVRIRKESFEEAAKIVHQADANP